MESLPESTWCNRLSTRGPAALLGLIMVLLVSWGIWAPQGEAAPSAAAAELHSQLQDSGRPSRDEEPMVPAEEREDVPKDSPALTAEYEAKALEAAQSATLIARAFVERRFAQTLHDLLPPSYLADVEAAVREFAVQMDPEIWARVVPIADRLVALAMRFKSELATPVAVLFGASQEELVQAQGDAERLIELVADGWQRLKDDGLTNLGQLRSFSLTTSIPTLVWMEARFYKWVDGLTSNAMTTNYRESSNRMANIQYQPAACSTPVAPEVVCLEGVANGVSDEIVMELVQGRWLPFSKKEWERDVRSIKDDFNEMGDDFRKDKPQIMDDIAEFRKKLAKAERAANLLEAATILEIPLPFPLDGPQPM